MSESGHASDESIHRLYDRLIEGWNAGSGEAFASVFADDGDLIGFDGSHFKGRDQIGSFHQRLLDTHMKGSRLVGRIMSVRFVSPHAAVLHAIGSTIMPGASRPSPSRDSIQTMVVIHRDGEWRLAAFQNTRVRPLGHHWGGTAIWMVTDWLWKIFGRKV
ncbi:hypothetical protein W02_01030 [Nitrospira sp. KM1]|uniref:SgcJ/EcaC family oxidoreductase n=1 Tax=Nitrospira sp. KM1 TaxID=1936990 RepID=UPI0013A712AA|nr:SgcJ/EcaC family oxidoreductase [Nitrospira sp. KM1]BCA52963.1 hypothetical protein W02_01030 [Nitrospira sp. KM1]